MEPVRRDSVSCKTLSAEVGNMERITLWTAELYMRAQKGLKREEGQTMAEYALILVLVAVAAIAAFRLLGTNINAKVSNIASQIGP
jgi:pilus assembly protein Flp/PilA